MKFNKEEVFPGSKVKLSLKASPGSIFAISAVDKSVHFLANANDVSRDQVRTINMYMHAVKIRRCFSLLFPLSNLNQLVTMSSENCDRLTSTVTGRKLA